MTEYSWMASKGNKKFSSSHPKGLDQSKLNSPKTERPTITRFVVLPVQQLQQVFLGCSEIS